jgi:hypothetical protein
MVGGAAANSSVVQAVEPDSARPPTEGHPLVGAWTVSIEEFPDDPSSLAVFHTDGTYEETDADGSRGIGAWEATGASSANLTIVSMTPTDEGELTPIVTIRAAVEASADGQSFSAEFTIELTSEGSPAGEFGPGHATGTRIAVEPMGTPAGSLEDLFTQFEAGTAPAAVPTTEPAAAPTTEPAAPSGALPPAFGITEFDLAEFWNVPQLGSEPVRGSGCGANGQLGDVIPDGLWAGYIDYDPTDDVFSIDVLCIYYGETADAVRAEGTANIVHDEPDYLIVNNSERRRQAANNLRAVLPFTLLADGRCLDFGQLIVEPSQLREMSPEQLYGDEGYGGLLYPQNQAWIRIDGGAVTWIAWGCDRPDAGVGG